MVSHIAFLHWCHSNKEPDHRVKEDSNLVIVLCQSSHQNNNVKEFLLSCLSLSISEVLNGELISNGANPDTG